MAVPFRGLTCSAQERYENLKPCFKATGYVPQMVPAGTVMLHQARLRHRGMSANNPCDMRAAGRHAALPSRARNCACVVVVAVCRGRLSWPFFRCMCSVRALAVCTYVMLSCRAVVRRCASLCRLVHVLCRRCGAAFHRSTSENEARDMHAACMQRPLSGHA